VGEVHFVRIGNLGFQILKQTSLAAYGRQGDPSPHVQTLSLILSLLATPEVKQTRRAP